jgi:hypothetical protein
VESGVRDGGCFGFGGTGSGAESAEDGGGVVGGQVEQAGSDERGGVWSFGVRDRGVVSEVQGGSCRCGAEEEDGDAVAVAEVGDGMEGGGWACGGGGGQEQGG